MTQKKTDVLGAGWLALLITAIIAFVVQFDRVIARFGNAPWLAPVAQDRQRSLIKAQRAELDHALPNFSDLVDFMDDRRKPAGSLNPYVLYYQKVATVFPSLSEPVGILGFIAYYQGDRKRSLDYFQKALGRDPEYFWFYFNIARIFYDEGNYEQAIKVMAAGLRRSPARTLQRLFLSKVYVDILKGVGRLDRMNGLRLKEGYQRGQQLLALCDHLLKDQQGKLGAASVRFTPAEIAALERRLTLEVF